MGDVTRLPHRLDPDALTVLAVVETPRGYRAKYNYDPESGLFRLKTLLPPGMVFPLDFGFIPSTRAEDGDPLDAMLLLDEPAPVGALVEARLVGVLEEAQVREGRRERNDRILATAVVSQAYAAVRTPGDLPAGLIESLTRFWVTKGDLDGKRVEILGASGPDRAVELIREASAAA